MLGLIPFKSVSCLKKKSKTKFWQTIYITQLTFGQFLTLYKKEKSPKKLAHSFQTIQYMSKLKQSRLTIEPIILSIFQIWVWEKTRHKSESKPKNNVETNWNVNTGNPGQICTQRTENVWKISPPLILCDFFWRKTHI